jgi:glutaminyl-peptide cyclotransferase
MKPPQFAWCYAAAVRCESQRVLLALLLLTAPAYARAQATPTVSPAVIRSFPHDDGAFTQGLLLHQGEFYESTGLLGRSSLRRVEPSSGLVLQQVDLPASEFGEGLTLVGEQLIQITWRNNIAHVYDRETFAETGSFAYDGEGWGLCYDGSRLVMSDGSSSLFFRDADTFALQGELTVLLDGEPIDQLNELECVGSLVYANVWQTDAILRIDPNTGRVLTVINAAGLLEPAEESAADVLNGIAFDPGSDHFFITGKLWPTVFEVSFPFESGFEPVGAGGAGSGGSAGSGAAGAGATGGSTTGGGGSTSNLGGNAGSNNAGGGGGAASSGGTGNTGGDGSSPDSGGNGSTETSENTEDSEPSAGGTAGGSSANSGAGGSTSEESEPPVPSNPARDASALTPAEPEPNGASSTSCACKVSGSDTAGVTPVFAVLLGLSALFAARRRRTRRIRG